MTKTSKAPKNILYFLLGMQGVLAFVLGISGNKLAEIIRITPSLLLTLTIIVMAVSLIISLAIARRENAAADPNQRSLFPPPNVSDRLSRLVLSRLVTIFPLGVVAGALVGSISIATFTRDRFPGIDLDLPDNISIEPYEIFSFMFALISLFLISRKRKDISLLLGYALGFAVSISGVLVVLRPRENSLFLTLLAWVVELFVAGFVMRSKTIDALYNELSGAVKHLFRERSD